MTRRTYAPHRAYSRNSTIVLVLLALVGSYVGFVWLSPRVETYRIKSSMKRICSSYMNARFYGEGHTNWKKEWEEERRKLRLSLQDDQWDFSVDQSCDRKAGCTCTALAAYELVTPWYLLEDYFEIPAYRSIHEIDIDVEYRTTY